MLLWGLGLFLLGTVVYFFTRQKYPFMMFVSGVGAGLFIAAIWIYIQLTRSIP